MSQIEASGNKSALWKVSGINKINTIQHSRLNPSFQLPMKFSPSKSGLSESRLFNSSIEKIKLSKINSPKNQISTPKKSTGAPALFSSHQFLKDSIEMKQQSPIKTPNQQRRTLLTKESCVSITEQQMKALREEAKKDVMHEYQSNRRLIHQLKEEFVKFKASVLSEIIVQKNAMTQIIEEIAKELKMERLKVSSLMQDLNNTEGQLKHHFDKKSEKIENLQSIIVKLEEAPVTSEEIQVLPNETNAIQPPQSPLSMESSQIFKKDSPDIKKCKEIVETINTLNEINDYPIDRPRSVQKVVIKEKILGSAKSNDNLWKEKTKRRGVASQISKAKTSHKFDKFYSAIQKLKGEVSEIMHFSEMKCTKNGRLIKEYQ